MLSLLERDKNNIFLICNILSIIPRIVAVSNRKSSTVDPHQHCFLLFTNLGFCPHVHSQAVFAEGITDLVKAR